LCLIPDDDLFDSINTGDAEVVTDRIDDFTENGVALQSGKHLQSDIIVTATGLKLSIVSDVSFSVDGQSVKFPETYSYKGMVFSDVPNVVQTFGYINASWTLRADLTAGYFCRLINRMDELHVRQCTPRLRDSDSDMRPRPWIEDFPAGYIQRAIDMLPKQGDRAPWIHTQDYTKDKKQIRRTPIDDDVLVFSQRGFDRGALAASRAMKFHGALMPPWCDHESLPKPSVTHRLD
jgi:monooxygenase